MANELSAQLRALTFDKINFVDDEAEAIVEGLATSALALDDAADAFEAVAGGDADQLEVAEALVNLADLFDDVNLSPTQSAKLDKVVNGLLKSGTDEQIADAKVLFTATLAFGLAAKGANEYFDELMKTDPPVEN
jgi:hypothetical protein